MTKPYIPLLTEVTDCNQIKAVNNLTGTALADRLAELSRWYAHFNGQADGWFPMGQNCIGQSSTTLAAKLSAAGAIVSNYRNSSYLAHARVDRPLHMGEATDVESKAPLAISTYWPGNWRPTATGDDSAAGGRLRWDISDTQMNVTVNALGSLRPNSDMPPWWPYFPSRGKGTESGAHSLNTHDFVSWIRVDDEIMKIVATPSVDGGLVRIQVGRGLFGTTPASHRAGTRVLSPVYVGARGTPDWVHNGSPARNDTFYSLRYALRIWQADGYGWIADRIKETFGSDLQGHNALWLDLYSCTQYNIGDPWGNAVRHWDPRYGTKMTTNAYGEAQLAKTSGLRSAFPGVRLLGNNLTWNIDCTDRIVQALDGAIHEYWLLNDATHSADWNVAAQRSFELQMNNWPGLYWIKWKTAPDADQYRRFSYGTLLLTLNSAATRFQYGGPFGLTKPQELYFWNWGAPLASKSAISEVKVPDMPLYRRDFANGIVVVNPTPNAVTYRLSRTYYNAVVKDAKGDPKAMSSVTIPANDAAFLLNSK